MEVITPGARGIPVLIIPKNLKKNQFYDLPVPHLPKTSKIFSNGKKK